MISLNHMIINEQTLIRLPVFTRSGEKLGHIIDIEIDVESNQVRKYFVGGRFQKDVYLIAPAQIVEITQEKIIVEDTVMKDPGEVKKKSVLPGKFGAVSTTEIN